MFDGVIFRKDPKVVQEQERKSMVKLYASGLLEVDLLGTAPHFADLERRKRASTRAWVE